MWLNTNIVMETDNPPLLLTSKECFHLFLDHRQQASPLAARDLPQVNLLITCWSNKKLISGIYRNHVSFVSGKTMFRGTS